MILLLAGVLGLAVGSYLNVVVWRVPRGLSTVSPRSACPDCSRPIMARDNVPLLSWVLLRGRCRGCGARISARYPLVEAGGAVAFGGVAALLGAELLTLPAHLYLAALTLCLVLIDIEHHRLPDKIVLPTYPVSVALLALASWSGTSWDGAAMLRALVGGGALFLFYFLVMFVYPRGMGFGDVKLAGVLGLYLAWWGWGSLLVGAFSAFVVGGAFALVLVLSGRANRGSKVPFGPWMLLGAWLGILAGEPIATWYLELVGL